MKKLLFALLLFSFQLGWAQKVNNKKVDAVVKEGYKLYRLEMASWIGTDIFVERYPDLSKIRGYFSYQDGTEYLCLFYSADQKVLGSIRFDAHFLIENAKIDFNERDFTPYEFELYTLRQKALELATKDPLFKFYENTDYNPIPIIDGKERKVYILTGTKQSGMVIFGNDYLITFDKKNEIKSKKALHQNIIPIEYGTEEAANAETIYHTHLPESGDLITATDICTILLYARFTNWKSMMVVSEKFTNIWNIQEEKLNVIPTKTIRKIAEQTSKE